MGEARNEQAEAGGLTEAERRQAKRERKGRIGPEVASRGDAPERTRAEAERRRPKREREGRIGPSSGVGEHGAEAGSKRLVNDEAPLLAFVHVPKTAGATVKGMFANAYSKAAMHDAGNFLGKDPEKTARRITSVRGGWDGWQRRGGRVTTGHVPYGLLREHLPADTRYLTFLRNPVARVLSHYNRHFRSHRASRKAEGEVKKFDSLEQGLVEMREPRLNNLATRLLCGDPSPVGELPTSALDDAKANLREFMFVGITERFDESVALLQRMLGMHAVPYGERQHVNPHRPPAEEVTDRQRALIEEHNQLDIELYEFARTLFEDALARADEGIAAEAETLHTLGADAEEEAQRATQDAREWLERELPIGTPRPIAELRAAAAEDGIEKRKLDSARRFLEVEKRDGDHWVRTTVTTQVAREWLERELPVGTTRPVAELRAAAAEVGIEKRKLGRGAQLLGAEPVAGPDGQDSWTRVQIAHVGHRNDPHRDGQDAPSGPLAKSTPARARQVTPETAAADPGGEEEPLIGFVHVPKTAGGTVKGMFANAYPQGAMRNAGNFFGKDSEKSGRKIAKRRDWKQWQRRGGRLTIGHVPYGLLREHMPAGTRYITFLREPVARVRSHYNRHLRAQRPIPDSGAEGELKKFGSIAQALIETREPRINNLATRLLCGDPSPVGELPASALDDAKANLREFTFVGITERFDESVALLQRRLGIRAVACGPRQHVNRQAPSEELTDRERALIEEHNQLDLELYTYALELFEAAMARDGEDMAAEVETLRRLNAAADEVAQKATQEACEWLEGELPIGTLRSIPELSAAAEDAGIEKRNFDSAKRLLEVDKREGPDGPSFVRSSVTLDHAREWLESELPVGATRSINELRTVAADIGIEKRKLGLAAQLLGAKEVPRPDGDHGWKRPEVAPDGDDDPDRQDVPRGRLMESASDRGRSVTPGAAVPDPGGNGQARKRARRSPEEKERRAAERRSRQTATGQPPRAAKSHRR